MVKHFEILMTDSRDRHSSCFEKVITEMKKKIQNRTLILNEYKYVQKFLSFGKVIPFMSQLCYSNVTFLKAAQFFDSTVKFLIVKQLLLISVYSYFSVATRFILFLIIRFSK